MSSGFSAGEAARLSRLSEKRVLSFARAGIVGVGQSHPEQASLSRTQAKKVEGPGFDFRDVALLKTAAQLIAAGVPAGKVRKTFRALRDQLPSERPHASTRVEALGRQLIARDEGAAWEPESGQMLFTFEERAAEIIQRSQERSAPNLSESVLAALDNLGNLDAADYWFDVAMGKEDSDPQSAYEHYVRALACNPEHIEATINIGRLCSSASDLCRAAAYFRQAVRLDPKHPVAQFNLAVTLHDLDELDDAGCAYRAALQADPSFADAHFNLAALLEQRGDR
ncbi:MAG: tetratricopeptide repeat protein, partial [Myxococcota bacterium]